MALENTFDNEKFRTFIFKVISGLNNTLSEKVHGTFNMKINVLLKDKQQQKSTLYLLTNKFITCHPAIQNLKDTEF